MGSTQIPRTLPVVNFKDRAGFLSWSTDVLFRRPPLRAILNVYVFPFVKEFKSRIPRPAVMAVHPAERATARSNNFEPAGEAGVYRFWDFIIGRSFLITEA